MGPWKAKLSLDFPQTAVKNLLEYFKPGNDLEL